MVELEVRAVKAQMETYIRKQFWLCLGLFIKLQLIMATMGKMENQDQVLLIPLQAVILEVMEMLETRERLAQQEQ